MNEDFMQYHKFSRSLSHSLASAVAFCYFDNLHNKKSNLPFMYLFSYIKHFELLVERLNA